MSSSTRALAWITLLLLLAAYCCGIMLANQHLPQADLDPGSASPPRAWHAPYDRDAAKPSLLSSCLRALRRGHDSYAAYRDWVYFGVEERTFRTLQAQGASRSNAGA